jgi:hypothetical protein
MECNRALTAQSIEKDKSIMRKSSGVADPFGTLAMRKVAETANQKAHPKSMYTNSQWDRIARENHQYLKIRPHGGGCCGSKHINYFPRYDIMWEKHINEVLDKYILEVPGQNYEVILPVSVATQLDCGWTKWLKKRKFKLVGVHNNSNSGNDLLVFHLSTHKIKKRRVPDAILKLYRAAPSGVYMPANASTRDLNYHD